MESNCAGLSEVLPGCMAKINEKIKTFDHTYYFSLASGNRKRQRDKQREMFSEPKKLVKQAAGYS